MSLIVRMLRDKAVYWPKIASDSFGKPMNEPQVPIEIKVRWEDEVDEIILPDGRRVKSKARVFVDRDIDVGGILWLGTLDQIDPEKSPYDNKDAWEVLKFTKLPDLRINEYLRTAYL